MSSFEQDVLPLFPDFAFVIFSYYFKTECQIIDFICLHFSSYLSFMLLKQPAFSSSTTLDPLQFFLCSLYSYIQTLSNRTHQVLVLRVYLDDTAGGKRDIVFLLDSYEDSRNGLPTRL